MIGWNSRGFHPCFSGWLSGGMVDISGLLLYNSDMKNREIRRKKEWGKQSGES